MDFDGYFIWEYKKKKNVETEAFVEKKNESFWKSDYVAFNCNEKFKLALHFIYT